MGRISYEIIGASAAALLLTYGLLVFNRLIRLRNRVSSGWSDIDVELKRRHDLIPNLVDTVRSYMAHERDVLEAVTQARTNAMTVGDNVSRRASAEMVLTSAVGNLLAVAEQYPALRAAENMKLLQEELETTENRIAFARQFYNSAVMQYNTAQSTFPQNLFSRALGFTTAAMFSARMADGSVQLLVGKVNHE